jgi:hypothetical protein
MSMSEPEPMMTPTFGAGELATLSPDPQQRDWVARAVSTPRLPY